jgi:hypothetical protein
MNFSLYKHWCILGNQIWKFINLVCQKVAWIITSSLRVLKKTTQKFTKASKKWHFWKARQVVGRLHARWIESAVAIASARFFCVFPCRPADRVRRFFERAHTHTRLIPCSSNELFDVCVCVYAVASPSRAMVPSVRPSSKLAGDEF